MDPIIKELREIRKALIAIASNTLAIGIALFVLSWVWCMTSCAPADEVAEGPWVVGTDTTLVMMFDMNNYDKEPYQGIYHGYKLGEDEPFLFGYLGRLSHVLVLSQMTEASVPSLPCTLIVKRTYGRP